MLETWKEASGWLAAIVSCLSFGSFAVPIKSNECKRIDVDPLVFQSYKTAMCLLTSWIVIPFGLPIYFTPWGIISGLFWVPAGVAAIYAVKNAGLAISQGLWSSIIVIVSFTWGIFIFHEQVKSIVGSLVAVGFMIVGLWGMSFFSSPVLKNYEQVQYDNVDEKDDNHTSSSFVEETSRSYDNDNYEEANSLEINSKRVLSDHVPCEGDDDDEILCENNAGLSFHLSKPENVPDENRTKSQFDYDSGNSQNEENGNYNEDYFVQNTTFEQSLERRQQSIRVNTLSKRSLGLIAAVFNGVWGGSIMVPMHYAPENAHGIGYVISFAIGATIITIFMWIARFGYHFFFGGRTLRGSYHSLPSFHFSIMWKPGGIAGLLWSIGNLSSMVSVQQLGEGVGYSLTQASMLVSGIWGIFYFREVVGLGIRAKWFLSAIVTIVGILMLSFEHVNDSSATNESVR